MKKIAWMALVAISITVMGLAGCKPSGGAQKNKERELPPEIAAAYREDAARLAVRELLSTTQTGENAADIPADRIQFFFGLLTKAYWMCKDVDSIPDLSGLHTIKNPSLRQVMVVLDKNSPFKENWSKGVTMTNNLYLNQLISRYRINIKNYRESSLGPTLIMETSVDVNTKELAFLIKNVETIRHAEAEGMVGDGNDIAYGADGKNAMALKFSIGEGDCPSGCTNRKSWVFYVGPEGALTYMGTRGSISAALEPPK